ncbi:hypothetical protein [Marinomonas ostreistagni]|uniref:hypothetical protein n=1 Tax=Marinomonas ostreistagni TaxID=359209 RepID=UPI001950E28B|nr:hypothetical protein [Marinomonas ostreistagni]MBM6550302.1 hypothetical protein [Marinomonas ostreistagni]
MKPAKWQFESSGLSISASRTIKLSSFKEIYVIEINGEVVKELSLRAIRASTRIAVSYQGSEFEFRFASKDRGLKLGLQVLRDGQYLCGDLNLQMPNFEKAKQQIDKGIILFIIKHGILKLGIPFASLMLFLNWPECPKLMKEGVSFVIMMVSFGVFTGLGEWWEKKSQLKMHR